jgi:hypothetical protein
MPPIVREMKLSNIAFAKRLRAVLRAAGIFAFTPLMSLFLTRFIALCVLWRALNVSMLRRCFMMMLNHYDDDGDGHDRHMAACIGFRTGLDQFAQNSFCAYTKMGINLRLSKFESRICGCAYTTQCTLLLQSRNAA